jgi:hypothetical protein
VNTTNYTPNISYTNGEREKISQGRNKEIEKRKNFTILLNEAKNHCLAGANKVATTVDETVR